jgi:hypothetical protein
VHNRLILRRSEAAVFLRPGASIWRGRKNVGGKK